LLLKKYIMEPGISRVYNGYLKSGSKQKLEKQRTALKKQRVIEEEAMGAQGRKARARITQELGGEGRGERLFD